MTGTVTRIFSRSFQLCSWCTRFNFANCQDSISCKGKLSRLQLTSLNLTVCVSSYFQALADVILLSAGCCQKATHLDCAMILIVMWAKCMVHWGDREGTGCNAHSVGAAAAPEDAAIALGAMAACVVRHMHLLSSAAISLLAQLYTSLTCKILICVTVAGLYKLDLWCLHNGVALPIMVGAVVTWRSWYWILRVARHSCCLWVFAIVLLMSGLALLRRRPRLHRRRLCSEAACTWHTNLK